MCQKKTVAACSSNCLKGSVSPPLKPNSARFGGLTVSGFLLQGRPAIRARAYPVPWNVLVGAWELTVYVQFVEIGLKVFLQFILLSL